MVESGRVPGKGTICASIEKVSRRVREKGRMTVCTEKWKNPDVYREKVESLRVSKIVPTSTEKKSNHCEYRKMVESGRVPGKGRIRASIEKVSRRVPKKGSNQCKYRKMVESSRVPGKCRIRASVEKLSGRVLKKGRISVSTENGRIRASTRKR